MPRNRSKRGKGGPCRANTLSLAQKCHETKPRASASNVSDKSPRNAAVQEEGISEIRSILDNDDICKPSSSSSASVVDSFNSNAAALYDELDSFRQRWKRELEETKHTTENLQEPSSTKVDRQKRDPQVLSEIKDNAESTGNPRKLNQVGITAEDESYDEAKRLFLMAVNLEQDDMHHESILYYKKAMHLYPDIEKAIFREQCEASSRAAAHENSVDTKPSIDLPSNSELDQEEKVDLHERIYASHREACEGQALSHCKPMNKCKPGVIHLSELPHELIVQIFRYVVGQELDLASLELAGMVCRGFYLLSRDQSLWRSICYSTWGQEDVSKWKSHLTLSNQNSNQVDWRRVFLERPRVNYDGVYISRTKYIRQGDVGFQDITYRPFHVIRYYRYLRFFPDKRVLILTTNEEPDRIIPIFRHALDSKQFSSELSILEGTFEFVGANQLVIVAEKDCRSALNVTNLNQRRQAHLHWSRQTPLAQKFNLKFELKTIESKPYKNNILKWLEYTILSRLETGQEITTFDLSADTFPNLAFSRVKKFNLRLTKPLASQ